MNAPLYTTRTLAALLNVSERTVLDLVATRQIAFVRIGGRALRYTHDDVAAYITRNRVPVATAQVRHLKAVQTA